MQFGNHILVKAGVAGRRGPCTVTDVEYIEY
jgi:hypothetical protein